MSAAAALIPALQLMEAMIHTSRSISSMAAVPSESSVSAKIEEASSAAFKFCSWMAWLGSALATGSNPEGNPSIARPACCANETKLIFQKATIICNKRVECSSVEDTVSLCFSEPFYSPNTV